MISPRTSSGHSALVTLVVIISAVIIVSSHQVCFIGSQYDPESGTQPRWFIHPSDPCKCTSLRLEGMVIHNAPYRQRVAYDLKELILSEEPSEIQAFFKCPVSGSVCLNPEQLGVADGSIPDERFSASSDWGGHYASNARLNQETLWSPDSVANSWIEVDLVKNTLVSGVITQGSPSSGWRVSKYKVKYQTLPSQPSVYDYVTDSNGEIEVFSGNIDDSATPVTNLFHDTINAAVVRLEPADRTGGVALRFELLGCNK